MGKRVNKVMEELEDMGIPGKLYFDKPQVINMSSYRKSEIPLEDPVSGAQGSLGPEEYYKRVTPCRLVSTKKVLGTYKLPELIEYPLSMRPSQDEAQVYINRGRINGYGEGSIVTRRHQDPWRHKWHGNWGMIVRIVGNVPWQSSEVWSPYVVQWFERPDVPYEAAWGEDLLLIHTCLDKDLLADILEAQGISKEVKK